MWPPPFEKSWLRPCILYEFDWQLTLYPEKKSYFFYNTKTSIKKNSKTVLFRAITKTFWSSFALILLSLLCWWETGNGIISFLIVDFHNIHLSSTDIWLFRNRKRSLISFDFEFVWLKTFWNVFQLSSEVVRIISVSPEKFLEFWNLGSAGSSRSPVRMTNQWALMHFGLWLGAEMQSTWLSLWTAFLSNF